jgi:PAS domain S-box-containing protein
MTWVSDMLALSASRSLWRGKASFAGRLRYLVALWGVGLVAIGAVTGVCFRAGLNSATTALIYMVVILMLSLLDSFVSSAIFSIFAVACLDYFFIPPLFQFDVGDPQDIATLVAFLFISLTVTSLVRRVRELVQTQGDQAKLLDLTHDPILVRDMNHVILYWNSGAERLYGWDRADVVGKVAFEVLGTTFPVTLDQITATLIERAHWEGEVQRVKRDGTAIWVACRWTLERDLDGQPIGIIETNNDITDRRTAEAALRRAQEAYLSEAQKLSHTGSFGWNTSTGAITWSSESFRIFGYDESVSPGLDLIFARVHPEDSRFVRRVIDAAIDNRQDFDVEHRLLMPDGSVKHIHVVARAVAEEPGTLHFMGAVMDITDRLRTEERLRQVQADFAHSARISLLGELAASIAHEVNQPLCAIETNGETGLRWLDRAEPNVLETRETLQRIVEDARRGADIITRIRSIAAGRKPERSALSLHKVIEESIAFLRHELVSRNVSVSFDLAPMLPEIAGDRIQLQQVVVNLTMNAAQAMERSDSGTRALRIATRLSDAGTLLCTFEDAGPGISPEGLEGLSYSFRTSKESGMGMGLRISRSIIEAHGGQIRADNGSILGGARFSVELPAPADATEGVRPVGRR